MRDRIRSQGFSVIGIVVALAIITTVGLGGWYVWSNNRNTSRNASDAKSLQEAGNNEKNTSNQSGQDETVDWVSVTTQGGAFSMKLPDGWAVTSYPGNSIGVLSMSYQPGIPATIQIADSVYMQHSLRFHAQVSTVDDAGLGPQWTSPQPGLTESIQDFSIASMHGKRYKAVFSQDLNQTLYQYIFDLGNNKKLDVLYAVYHDRGEKDDVEVVEKAIKTIHLR